jgi:hypothetical protein
MSEEIADILAAARSSMPAARHWRRPPRRYAPPIRG